MTLVFCICLFVSLPALPSQEQTVTCRRLSEDVLVFEEPWGEGHMVAVSTQEGIVVVDTFISTGLALDARRKIEEEFTLKPIRYVINTHYHSDHCSGNQVFAEATIIAHINSLERMRQTQTEFPEMFENWGKGLEAELNSLQPDSAKAKQIASDIERVKKMLKEREDFIFTPPTILLQEGAVLKLGGKTFELLYYGPGHTDNDLVIFVPEERLLITGDLIFNKRTPPLGLSWGGDVLKLIDILEKLTGFRDLVQHVVPGHGPVGSIQIVSNYHNLLIELRDSVLAAMQRGLTLEQAKKEIKMEKYNHYSAFSESRISSAVEVFWKSIEKPGSKSN